MHTSWEQSMLLLSASPPPPPLCIACRITTIQTYGKIRHHRVCPNTNTTCCLFALIYLCLFSLLENPPSHRCSCKILYSSWPTGQWCHDGWSVTIYYVWSKMVAMTKGLSIFLCFVFYNKHNYQLVEVEISNTKEAIASHLWPFTNIHILPIIVYCERA